MQNESSHHREAFQGKISELTNALKGPCPLAAHAGEGQRWAPREAAWEGRGQRGGSGQGQAGRARRQRSLCGQRRENTKGRPGSLPLESRALPPAVPGGGQPCELMEPQICMQTVFSQGTQASSKPTSELCSHLGAHHWLTPGLVPTPPGALGSYPTFHSSPSFCFWDAEHFSSNGTGSGVSLARIRRRTSPRDKLGKAGKTQGQERNLACVTDLGSTQRS